LRAARKPETETPMAIDIDDLEPRQPAKKPKDLSGLAIEELKDYIARLEAEIGRAKDMIAAKEKHRAGAQGLFKR
jgi:uncharacterized small protein (DUF1192 family)